MTRRMGPRLRGDDSGRFIASHILSRGRTEAMPREWALRRAAKHSVLEEHAERRRACRAAVHRTPLAVGAERAALHLRRLELDDVEIDVDIGRRRHCHEGGHAFVAQDHRVVALDHDPVAAGRLERALQRRPARVVLLFLLRLSARDRERRKRGRGHDLCTNRH
jgi:hypothetical protein